MSSRDFGFVMYCGCLERQIPEIEISWMFMLVQQHPGYCLDREGVRRTLYLTILELEAPSRLESMRFLIDVWIRSIASSAYKRYFSCITYCLHESLDVCSSGGLRNVGQIREVGRPYDYYGHRWLCPWEETEFPWCICKCSYYTEACRGNLKVKKLSVPTISWTSLPHPVSQNNVW